MGGDVSVASLLAWNDEQTQTQAPGTRAAGACTEAPGADKGVSAQLGSRADHRRDGTVPCEVR